MDSACAQPSLFEMSLEPMSPLNSGSTPTNVQSHPLILMGLLWTCMACLHGRGCLTSCMPMAFAATEIGMSTIEPLLIHRRRVLPRTVHWTQMTIHGSSHLTRVVLPSKVSSTRRSCTKSPMYVTGITCTWRA